MMSFPVWWCSCVSCSIHKNTQNNTWKSHCSVPPLFLSLPLSVSLLSFTLVSSSLPPSSLHLWLAFTLLFLHSHLRSPHMLFLSFSHSYSIYPFPLSRSPPPFSLSLSHSLWCPPPSPFCSVAVHFLAWHDTLENSSTILSPSERDARQPVPPVSSLSPSLLFFQLKFSFSSSVTQMTFPNPSSLPCTHSCRHAHVYRHQRENVCVCF